MQKVLITGSTGFIGSRLAQKMGQSGVSTVLPTGFRMTNTTDWAPYLKGCGVVVHLAARVHHLQETASDPLAEYRRVNVDATACLLRQAEAAGVKRFIFMSTIKVLGESTPMDLPFNDDSLPNPQDPYALSKWEAEELIRGSALDYMILRIPLVYGPGAKGNLLHLMRWIDRGLPLPFAAIQNRRSLLGLDNLCDLIIQVLDYPAILRETFVVAENLGIALPDLVQAIALAMEKSSRLWAFPQKLLQYSATFFGVRSVAERLLGSLSVDASRLRAQLRWVPSYAVSQGLQNMVKAYQTQQVKSVCG